MIYIAKEDLIEVIQERLLDESVQIDTEMLDRLEAKAIEYVISYISGVYDTSKIFGTPVMKAPLLMQVISMLVVYRAVRRNAARKVPDDFPDMFKEAKQILENIQSLKQSLPGMPLVVGPANTTASLKYGTTRNDDYYL